MCKVRDPKHSACPPITGIATWCIHTYLFSMIWTSASWNWLKPCILFCCTAPLVKIKLKSWCNAVVAVAEESLVMILGLLCTLCVCLPYILSPWGWGCFCFATDSAPSMSQSLCSKDRQKFHLTPDCQLWFWESSLPSTFILFFQVSSFLEVTLNSC